MLIYKSYPKNRVMTKKICLDNEDIFNKIKIISNRFRFRILELTQNKEINITELGERLNLAYNKCADYVKMLEGNELVIKKKDGKIVLIRSNINISKIFND